ncbi:hypothetical protein [Halobacterium yunchengense]|uniref:hypothetical protein n=1 Tax=Halobacterium yunchengense TaxID=3108497 RepID=UPI00300A0780
MSDETVVETDGVTVSKFFNAEDFPVPAVAFDVESGRTDEVTLRIVDEIPEEFGIDQIGFHPEYGSEHWTASGDGVVRFERDLEPGESFTTVYGVRMEEGQDETPFLSAPTVELEGEGIDAVVPPESTDVVRELAGGERDTVPGLEDDEEVAAEASAGGVESIPDDDAEILEGDVGLGDPAGEPGLSADADPASPDDAPDEDSDEDAADEAEPALDEEPSTEPEAEGFGADQPDPPQADPGLDEPEAEGYAGDADAESTAAAAAGAGGLEAGDVASALAAAIRNDEVDDDDLETIRSALGGVPNSTEVEIEHLQSRVSELEAYTDALEEFLDEEGTAQQIVDDVEDDVAALSADVEGLSEEVAEVQASVEDAADDREALRDRVAGVEDDLGAVDDLVDTVERVRGDVEAIDERLTDAEEAAMTVEDVEDDVDDLEDDLEALEEHVDEIEQWRSQLSDVFGA